MGKKGKGQTENSSSYATSVTNKRSTTKSEERGGRGKFGNSNQS
jgi:hypothetical protein